MLRAGVRGHRRGDADGVCLTGAGQGDGAVSADDNAGRVSGCGPALVTRAALVCPRLLLWFAVLPGTYGLYFFVVLASTLLAPWLLVPLLVLAVPLAVLLLFLSVGALWAAQGIRSAAGSAGSPGPAA